MEPAFQRGDLLFLWNRNLYRETDVGEVVVYNVQGKVPAAPSAEKTGQLQLTVLPPGYTNRSQGSSEVWLWVRGPSSQQHAQPSYKANDLVLNRPKAKLLTKGDNNAADDTELVSRHLPRGPFEARDANLRGLVRATSRLLGAEGHHWERSGLRAVPRVRYNIVIGESVAQDGYVGHHGFGGDPPARVGIYHRDKRRFARILVRKIIVFDTDRCED